MRRLRSSAGGDSGFAEDGHLDIQFLGRSRSVEGLDKGRIGFTRVVTGRRPAGGRRVSRKLRTHPTDSELTQEAWTSRYRGLPGRSAGAPIVVRLPGKRLRIQPKPFTGRCRGRTESSFSRSGLVGTKMRFPPASWT
jgi:hypothetical protein